MGRLPESDKLKEYRSQNKALKEENKDMARLLDLTDKLDRITIAKIRPSFSTKTREAVALSLLSDVHAEQKILSASVNGINQYNPTICKSRLEWYFINLLKLIKKERQDIKINELLLGFLGDFIHGFIHEEYVSTNYMTPIEASLFVTELLIAGVNYLLKDKELKKIRIVCKVGNHSRTTLKPYTSKEAVMSYEWVIYKHLEKYFANEDRIEVILEPNYFTYVKVYDMMIRMSHGHNVKFGGGIGGLEVPLKKAVYRSNEQIKADLDCIGHFHQFLSLQNVIVNGCVNGFDDYCIRIGARPEKPRQAFALIDKKLGRTVTAPIFLEDV